METRPEPPPEGRLIGAAAARLGLSIREAARRAGLSYGRWRQIVTGYQNVSPGSYAPVRAPAGTLARMARVVGVTPEQLESEGCRPDAAAILAGLLGAEDDPTLPGIPAAPGPAPAGTAVPAGADPQALAEAIAAYRDAAALFALEDDVWYEIRTARNRGTPEDAIFTDVFERGLWLTPLTSEEDRAAMIAALRYARRAPRPRRNSGNSGGPPVTMAGLPAAWGAA